MKPQSQGNDCRYHMRLGRCLETFIDSHSVKNVLELHDLPEQKPYYLGFFLVGAYQESLSNEHNLFGAIDEVEVMIR